MNSRELLGYKLVEIVQERYEGHDGKQAVALRSLVFESPSGRSRKRLVLQAFETDVEPEVEGFVRRILKRKKKE